MELRASIFEGLLQGPIFVHLNHDVSATDEFPAHVQLKSQSAHKWQNDISARIIKS